MSLCFRALFISSPIYLLIISDEFISKKPSDFTQFKFAHQKYFNHVGLFLHSSNEYEKYIYLTDIEDIIDNGSKTFVYGLNEKRIFFVLNN